MSVNSSSHVTTISNNSINSHTLTVYREPNIFAFQLNMLQYTLLAMYKLGVMFCMTVYLFV